MIIHSVVCQSKMASGLHVISSSSESDDSEDEIQILNCDQSHLNPVLLNKENEDNFALEDYIRNSDNDDLPDIHVDSNHLQVNVISLSEEKDYDAVSAVSSHVLDTEKPKKKRTYKKNEDNKVKMKQVKNEKMIQKSLQPQECLKFLVVKLDTAMESVNGNEGVLKELENMNIKYELELQPVPFSVTFERINPVTYEKMAQDVALVIIFLNSLIEAVKSERGTTGSWDVTKRFSDKVGLWKEALNCGTVVISILKLDGLSLKSQSVRDVKQMLTLLMVEHSVDHRIFTSMKELAVFISRVAKAAALKPYKESRRLNRFDVFVDAGKVKPVRVDKGGLGLLKLWIQQLKQFNNVGIEVAQAICQRYPSPLSLIKAYKGVDEDQAAHLLADIPVRRGIGPLTSSRKVGPELSRKIHSFFTSTDPDLVL